MQVIARPAPLLSSMSPTHKHTPALKPHCLLGRISTHHRVLWCDHVTLVLSRLIHPPSSTTAPRRPIRGSAIALHTAHLTAFEQPGCCFSCRSVYLQSMLSTCLRCCLCAQKLMAGAPRLTGARDALSARVYPGRVMERAPRMQLAPKVERFW